MSTRLTWREVISEWCEEARGAAPTGVPKPLAEFCEAGGAAVLSRQNRFQVPVNEDGWSVFYVENQYVCTWAYRTGDAAEDPEVHVRDHQASNPTYVPVGCRLDAFLSAAAVIELTFAAPFGHGAEGPTRDVNEILGLDRVDLPELGWPAGVTTSYYRGPDLLAFAQDEKGYSFAFIGARSAEALREIDERIATNSYWDPT